MPNSTFCATCGASVNPSAVVCLKCGCRPSNGSEYCGICGVKRVNASQVVCLSCGKGPVTPPTSEVPQDQLVATLLAALLGVFGVHKFYLKCNAQGWTYLLISILGGVVTCGVATAVMLVVSWVEAIIYITRPAAEFIKLNVEEKKPWF